MGGATRGDRAALAMALFSGHWRAKYGKEYAPAESDWSLLRKFIRGTAPHLLADLPEAFERYLADESPFVMQEKRHNLKFFLTNDGFNKYRTPPVMVMSKREINNHVAGEQWLAMDASRNGHGRR